MTPKTLVKISIDFLMLLSLLALMAHELIGAATHEWIGAGMIVLVIVHNILNRKWWGNLLNGRYTLVRTIQTILVFGVFFGMLMQMVSGIMPSRHVFAFLSISTGASFARTMHLIGAYWSLVLMSVHLGFHGSMLMEIARKMAHIKESSRVRSLILRFVGLSVSAYGIYAFMQREFGSYMLLKNQFVFFDFNEPLILFFFDYIAIVTLFVCIGHYTMRGIMWAFGKRKQIVRRGDN